MMRQNDNNTILYGIRKIEHGAYGSDTMFPICVKAVSEYLGDDVSYAKGIRAYQAWKDMLLQEKWFENGSTFDNLFSKLLVQNDAMTCIHDGRKWAAKYFEELAERYGDSEKMLCMDIAKSFNRVSRTAGEMKSQIGDWNDIEKMQKNFGDQLIRKKLGELIDEAGKEDSRGYEQIKLLYNRM